MTLPLLLSVPHAGLHVPTEAKPYCVLSRRDIIEDSDEQADEVYNLREYVTEFVTTNVARAIIDVNRAPDDRRPDGVVKTRTCWNVPVYAPHLPEEEIRQLLQRYYRPYHERLSACADGRVRIGVDCHTMAAVGPPVAPDPGERRPHLCLGDLSGVSIPSDWMRRLADCFCDQFGESVAVNRPFAGGYIVRSHHPEMPWVQIELSRAPFMSAGDKRSRLLAVLTTFCEHLS